MTKSMDNILDMTIREILDVGEMTMAVNKDGAPIGLVVVIKGEAVCREILDVIKRHEEDGNND